MLLLLSSLLLYASRRSKTLGVAVALVVLLLLYVASQFQHKISIYFIIIVFMGQGGDRDNMLLIMSLRFSTFISTVFMYISRLRLIIKNSFKYKIFKIFNNTINYKTENPLETKCRGLGIYISIDSN
ncbi:hypothetical protein QTP88_007309 [Uroleucon formosanum]